MLTALTDLDTVKECLALGVSYFIRKDTPVPKMIELIKSTWEAFYKQNTPTLQKETIENPDLNKNLSERIKEDESFEL